MMNGDLDPMTPLWLAELMRPQFVGTHQRFVTVPRAAHCATCQTPVAPGEQMCGLALTLSFLQDPTAPLDDSCLADIPAESFIGDPALNDFVFGNVDLWENVATVAPSPEPSADRMRQLERARRQLDRAGSPRVVKRSGN
jgi:hypothetical protein